MFGGVLLFRREVLLALGLCWKKVEEVEGDVREAEEERLKREMLEEAPSVPTAIQENAREERVTMPEKTKENQMAAESTVSKSREDDLMMRMKMLSVGRSTEETRESRKSLEDTS